jgi:hypothetical protein
MDVNMTLWEDYCTSHFKQKLVTYFQSKCCYKSLVVYRLFSNFHHNINIINL